MSPAYDPGSYALGSPAYEPTSPAYEPTSPAYEPKELGNIRNPEIKSQFDALSEKDKQILTSIIAKKKEERANASVPITASATAAATVTAVPITAASATAVPITVATNPVSILEPVVEKKIDEGNEEKGSVESTGSNGSNETKTIKF